MKKKEKKVRQFFQVFVSLFFSFCKDKFGESPSFDGSSPRDLGLLYDAMEKKAAEKGMVWDEDLATRSFNAFLEFAWKDSWLQQNFLLFNLNRQKDKIFFQIKSSINGKSNTGTPAAKQFGGNHKTMGQHLFAERLRGKLNGLNGE